MTIHRDYMLKKPSGPSMPKRFLDQRLVPLAVSAVGVLEVELYRVSDRTGIRPALLMTGLMAGVSFLLLSRWRGRGRRLSH